MAGVRVASDKGVMALVVAVLVMCGGGSVVTPAAAATLVPAVYVFGDSTVDVGNNQYLPGNVLYPLPLPYGMDLPQELRPTGRASNGYNVADAISRLMGFNMSPPAYLSLPPEMNDQILSGFGGVNYGSGDSGILNKTGLNKSMPLAQQVGFFAATKSKMIEHAGDQGTVDEIERRVSESLFFISSGGNDMFEFLKSPVLLFYIQLATNYRKHLNTLYDHGARRFGIVNVPPIGCVPALRNRSDTGACMEFANNLSRNFNDNWLSVVMKNFAADPERPGITYSVGNSYNMITNFTADPEAAGFSEVASACCGDGRLGVNPWCHPGGAVCNNRTDHLYWDLAHSTDAAAHKGAALIFDAPVDWGFAAPINFRQLVSDGFSSI
ncbi:GDSL esterase/lipase At5g55050-like [Lolium rigidum]|uniref:GDSL esterase/lipase At5g55050-like n=1 Tax=Lolium rigidum TaxID=89674 RepID=UPI001F5C3675|nr:GDSL esterase/lipase At5g55050-like [Lolium rigidum]